MPENTIEELKDFLVHHEPVDRLRLLQAGDVVGGWRVTGFLARGGHAEVYRVEAVDGVRETDGRGARPPCAALKLLARDDAPSRLRFAREVELLCEKLSPALPRIYDAGESGGRSYFVAELLEPAELPRTDGAVAAYLLAVCRAVAALHRAGLVHRDVKPANIMRRSNGELVLIDLGLVKAATMGDSSIGVSVTLVDGHVVGAGTPRYAAPEQFNGGAVSPATDIHALGMLANDCFNGRPPRAWGRIIGRSTSSIPERRYVDVDAFVRAIRLRHVGRACAWGFSLLALVVLGAWGAFTRAVSPIAPAKAPASSFDSSRVAAEENRGGVQLWENGPYWAECNVGATKPEEYGYYFWWGDTVGYKRNAANDGWISVKDGSSYLFGRKNCPTLKKDVSALQSAGYVDSMGNLAPAHDAATVHLGAPWRMPTAAEVGALVDNCTSKWITTNGVSGRLVTGKGAYVSKSIFLPAVGFTTNSVLDFVGSRGCYWTSTPNSANSYGALHSAWGLTTYADVFYQGDYYDRHFGRTVRPLRPSSAIK